MRTRWITWAVLAVLVLPGVVMAGEGVPRLSLSAGARVRQISADFKLGPPSGYDAWRFQINRSDDEGATRLFTDGDETLVYADGAVFSPYGDGTALFGVMSDAQVLGRDGITFNSYSYGYESSLRGMDAGVEDEETCLSPYIAARLRLMESKRNCTISLLGMYSPAMSHTKSGWRQTGRQQLTEHTTHHTFLYALDDFFSSPLPPAPFAGGSYWVVFDPDTYADTWSFFGVSEPPPVATQSTRSSTPLELRGMTSADLEMNLHELMFGVECSMTLRDRINVAVSVGPTLNVVDWDLTVYKRWERGDTGETLGSWREREKDTDIIVGAAAQVSATMSLDNKSRYFVEVGGGYSWADDLSVKSGNTKADVDLSSFTANVGIGVNL